jgi:YidC/Oxa1 family membrane protein insertase
MYPIYLIVGSFGWAVIIFTLIVKLASFPLTLKQQKNMAVSQLFTPRVQEIQRKHRGNQAKLQEEMAKLQKEGYNPVGGCGTMLLTMIILFGILDVVYKPMTHMERFDKETVIAYSVDLSKQVEFTSIILESDTDSEAFFEYRRAENEDWRVPAGPRDSQTSEVSDAQRRAIGQYILDNFRSINEMGLSDTTVRSITTANGRYVGLRQELVVVSQFSRSPEAFEPLRTVPKRPGSSEMTYERLEQLQENMMFMGVMDLSAIPRMGTPNALWIIVFFCFGFSVVQAVIQRKIQKRTMPANMPNPGMMKAMLYMGPAFALIIVFQFPAGAGLYWAISNLFMIAQSLIIFKLWPPERMKEEAKARVQASLGTLEVTAKVTDIDEEGNETVTETKVSEMSKREQEEYYKKKLEAARKADAEKYGD